MNSVTKGNNFEKSSLEVIYNALKEDKIGLPEKYVRVFQKKGYYSEKRKSEIVFDISIEVWPPEAERYSLIYLIECKSYNKKVPVDDVEEFYTKIQQVAGVNAKGVFITNRGFQEGAYTFAESTGMMLILAESSNNYEIILHKRKRESPIIPKLKGAIDCKNADTDLFERLIDRKIRKVYKLSFSGEAQIFNFNIRNLSKEGITIIAELVLNKIDTEIRERGRPLSKKKLEKYIIEVLGLKIDLLPRNSDLLGTCDVAKKTISIHPSLVGSRRYLFILCHELGHYILHNSIQLEQEVYESFSDAELNFRTERFDLTNPKHWIEWQANYFSSALILPRISLTTRLYFCQEKMHGSHGTIFLDDQWVNVNHYNDLVTKLAYYFDVTKTSVIYRLTDLNLLKNHSRLQSISHVLSEHKSELFV
jgi:Zn-dependent peptidase ImmA (M78 family)